MSESSPVSPSRKYGIAEIFTSPQGEGLYAGALMTFIRFAGCSVGKHMSEQERYEWHIKEPNFSRNAELPIYTEKCTTYDGREFLCDTDFQTHEVFSVEQILDYIPLGVTRVCLTGGEPLDQPLAPLLDALSAHGMKIHIETSGTVDIATRAYPKIGEGFGFQGWLWITVSPKKGVLQKMVQIADEIKLLVDSNFDVDKVPPSILGHELVWIQPINHEFSVDDKNMAMCLALQKRHPSWRISSQSHKIWNVR